MMLGSYYYKGKAKEYLKGNWQNAMLVAFFSGILSTVLQVLQLVLLPGQSSFPSVDAYADALLKLPQQNWLALLMVSLLTLVFSPVLGLGCNHYFVELTRKNICCNNCTVAIFDYSNSVWKLHSWINVD